MPIRFVDKVSRLGRIQASLGDVTAVMTGSHDAPEGRTGVVNAMLAPTTALITGAFTPSAHRTGTIAATLAPTTATMTGSFVNAGWGTVPAVSFQPAIAADFSFAPYAPPGSSIYIIGTAEQEGVENTSKVAELGARGVTLDSAGKRLVYDGVGTAGTVSGLILEDVDVGDVAADWESRISGPGVVWCHAFDSDAEVNAFRWSSGYGGGNDPLAIGRPLAGNVMRLAGAGPGGMDCLQITRPAGTGEVGTHWWRPYSPLVGSGNGKGVNDPGANGTLTPQAYAATDGGSQIYSWGARGFYGHPSYHTGSVFDGSEYWLQMRVKMDPRRAQSGMPTVGKLSFQTVTYESYVNQEIVTYSGGQHSAIPTQNNFAMYQGYLYEPMWGSSVGGGGSSTNRQPGNELGFCNPAANPNTCWAWSGGWDTVLYHVVPGRHGVDEQVIQVYAAHEGETSYTRIWDDVYIGRFETGYPFGYNALILSTYNNGLNCPSEFWHRWAQIIFSKEFIPCPQD